MEISSADKLARKMEILKVNHDNLNFEDPKNKMREVLENGKLT